MIWILAATLAMDIALPGRFIELAELPDAEAAWLGLYCEGGSCSLRATPLKTSSNDDGALVAAAGTPLLLVQGLEEGEVATEHVGLLPLPRYASTRVGDARLVATGGNDYRLMLRQGDAYQELVALGATEDTTPGLIWAGDLDRDGRLDLLLTTSGQSQLLELRLYLSSLAEEGELVGQAGRFRAVVPKAPVYESVDLPPGHMQILDFETSVEEGPAE